MNYKAIGFANKFYTLWDVSTETRDLGNGHHYEITHYYYIKNISFDKETVKKLYPDLTIDETLKGHTASWQHEKEVWDNVDTFRFGKYKYEKIADIHDINYTAWYWDQICAEHKDFVSEFLKENGYEIRTRTWISYDGYEKSEEYLMSPEALEAEKENNERVKATLEKCTNGESFEFVPEYNLNEIGEYSEGDVIFKFPEVKEMYYQGYSYYLPVLNGKSKRFKNKNVKITKYSFTYNDNTKIIEINVEDFEITK